MDNKCIVPVDIFINYYQPNNINLIITNLKLGDCLQSKRSITSAVLQADIMWFYSKFFKSY